MRGYRDLFRPGPLARPHAILALSVFCADTDAAAARMASSMLVSIAELRAGRPGRLRSPDEALAHPFAPVEQQTIASYRRLQIVGTPDTVRERIRRAAEDTGADEVMVATHAYEIGARLRSYELVAGAFA